jgi:hypothetical protein
MQFKLLWKYKAILRLKFRKLKPSQVRGTQNGRNSQYSRCKPCKSIDFIWQRSLNQVPLPWMLHKIYYLPITRSVPGIFVLPVETNLHNIVLICLFCKISIFHAWIMPRFCNNKAVGNCEVRGKPIGI